MRKKLLAFAFAAAVCTAAACSSNQTNDTGGDSGDSATLGTGTDSTGSMVDTGSAAMADTMSTP